MALRDYVNDDGTPLAARVRKALDLVECDARSADIVGLLNSPVIGELAGMAVATGMVTVEDSGAPLFPRPASEVAELLDSIAGAWNTAGALA